MSSLRTTNLLLAVIALCLALIAGRTVLERALPEASAQPAAQSAHLIGCATSNAWTGCQWVPVRVNEVGILLTMTQK